MYHARRTTQPWQRARFFYLSPARSKAVYVVSVCTHLRNSLHLQQVLSVRRKMGTFSHGELLEKIYALVCIFLTDNNVLIPSGAPTVPDDRGTCP